MMNIDKSAKEVITYLRWGYNGDTCLLGKRQLSNRSDGLHALELLLFLLDIVSYIPKERVFMFLRGAQGSHSSFELCTI